MLRMLGRILLPEVLVTVPAWIKPPDHVRIQTQRVTTIKVERHLVAINTIFMLHLPGKGLERCRRH